MHDMGSHAIVVEETIAELRRQIKELTLVRETTEPETAGDKERVLQLREVLQDNEERRRGLEEQLEEAKEEHQAVETERQLEREQAELDLYRALEEAHLKWEE